MDKVLGSKYVLLSRCQCTMNLWCNNLRQWEGPSLHRVCMLLHVHMALMGCDASISRCAIKCTTGKDLYSINS